MRTIRFLAAFAALCIFSPAWALPGLPGDVDADPSIPTPADVLGFEPGEWHPRHDQVVAYMEALAEASDRMHLETIGHTHGNRPLLMATFASPERLADIDAIKAARQDHSVAGEGPPVAWLGYTVHGNEASGVSAALVMAWYLAASRDEQVRQWLDEMIIVMEPGLNPDGIDRFAHWVNMHKGRHPSADPMDREHTEAWPNGRTNYYWFDLNRDWMPLVHPESKARLAHYHAWRPHVLTDHHEMGANSTYFFQPGVPERANPIAPERNFELTARIAEYHGQLLDDAGEPYFTREMFDDYYVGKGSTYPDLTGGIGILFEQASARGHLQDTDYGERTFADAVANQVITSRSTLAATYDLAEELIAFQSEFFNSARDQAGRDRNAGWVLGDGGDPARATALIELLLGHGIAVHAVEQDVEVAGRSHGAGSAWVIPAGQPHYRLLKAILEPVTELPMETFYDVSAWPLGLAYDLPLEPVRRLPGHAGEPLAEIPNRRHPAPATEAVAWLIPWNQYRADAVLAALLAEGYRVQAATRTLTAVTHRGERSLVRGSLIVHAGIQPDGLDPVGETLAGLAERHSVEVLAAERGLAGSGIDLGSPSAPVLKPVRPAMLTGSGISANHAGYIWHWFDTRLEQPLTHLDWVQLFEARLDEYTHLILPDGEYEFLPEWAREKLVGFVTGGGILLATRGASSWVEELTLDWQLVDGNDNEQGDESAPERKPYGDFQDDFAREVIGGSALAIELDITHPLGFGYERTGLTVFRRGRHVMKPVANPYAQAAVYADEPLAAGYLSAENRERLAGQPAISVSRHENGMVIRMADDAVFRGYWRGSEKLFANALFFGQLIQETQLPDQGASE